MIFYSVYFLTLFSTAISTCYLPVEYQGIFSTQSSVSERKTHKYSQITILPDAIPVWGVCHKLNGTTLILYDGTGGQECFRCFHVSLKSPNIIQVHTEGLDKCYMSESSALSSCPKSEDIKRRIAREIMLYKSRSFTREGKIDRVLCPFSGKFHFKYDVNDKTENQVECSEVGSTITNCPKASEFQLKFSNCKFQDTYMLLQCLGHWRGPDDFQYFALWDTRVASDHQPQYRCAMYAEDEETGKISIAFSVDATCTNLLLSPYEGYETMELTPFQGPSPPAPVHTFSCVFPQWAQGLWKDIEIKESKLWWRNINNEKVYEMMCMSQNDPSGERYALYSINQCGYEEYTCLWIKQRDTNILEFKTATIKYNHFNKTRICADDVFIGEEWHTQGRITNSQSINCPVLGKYTGIIPDAPDLCAKLASDCQNPALMHYTVSSCKNATQIFENRKYQCLGQWKERGIMYTFTYRHSVRSYECFAGVVVNENEAFIMEAGTNCERGLQPLVKGMKLYKEVSCNEINLTKEPAMVSEIPPSNPAFPSWWPSTSRKPWTYKPTTITTKPRRKTKKPKEETSTGTELRMNFLLMSLTLLPLLIT